MTKERRLEAIIFALSLVPIVLLAAAFLFVKHRWPFGLPDYNRYREFWGGAPSEVFSHWLDMVVLSGSAFSLGWFFTLEAFARQRQKAGRSIAWLRMTLPICVCGSITAGVGLDSWNGEGTVVYVSVIGFLPVLVSWHYLMRKTASSCHWNPTKVLIISTVYVVLNAGAQLFY